MPKPGANDGGKLAKEKRGGGGGGGGKEEENSLLGKGGEGERLLALLGHPFPLPLLDLKVEEQFVIRWREGRGRCGKWRVKGRENDPLCFPELRTIAALAFSKCFLCEVGRVRLRFLLSHFPPRASNSEIHGEREGGFRQ